MNQNRYAGPFSGMVIFLVGSTIGGILALLAGTDEKGETRPLVKKRIKFTKTRLAEGAEWATETVQELAETVPANIQKIYTNAVKILKEKVAAAKKALGRVDRDKYTTLVNEVVAGMKQAGKVTGTQVGMLKDYLMQDYALLTTPAVKPKAKRRPRKTAN
ncbi:hypothetical protein A2W24_03000 [Microgenomates group bacterium RBG_16_45_19]|nr:MAG: hypothetical protein A2W24_03000 [Microgenomates group bacterium RBG_16_45_19]